MKNPIESAIEDFQAGNQDKAANQCRDILESDPGNIQATYILAKIADQEEDYEAGARHMQTVWEADKANPDLQLEYGRALRLAKRPEEAMVQLRDALGGNKPYFTYVELGLVAADLGQTEEAERMFTEALRLKPDCHIALRRLGNIAARQGRLDEAIQYYGQLAAHYPNTIHSYPEFIRAHLKNRDPQEALRLCEKCLSLEPACTGVLALKYLALCESGDTEAAASMGDPDQLVLRVHADCPADFTDISQFNLNLADHILNHTQKTRSPELYTTSHGWQTETGTLFSENPVLGDTFNSMVKAALDAYMAQLPDNPEHPVNIGRPTQWHLESWAVVLRQQGHQDPHIHPMSWLSGCYYVQLPGDFDDQPAPDAGHIYFGEAEQGLCSINQPIKKSFKPVEGDFFIFPSYFWHHTAPLQSTEQRICIAFDMVPTKGWGK